MALGGSAFNGRFTLATGVFVTYVAAVAIYAVLRVRRYMLDRRGASVGTAAGETGLSEA